MIGLFISIVIVVICLVLMSFVRLLPEKKILRDKAEETRQIAESSRKRQLERWQEDYDYAWENVKKIAKHGKINGVEVFMCTCQSCNLWRMAEIQAETRQLISSIQDGSYYEKAKTEKKLPPIYSPPADAEYLHDYANRIAKTPDSFKFLKLY